MAKYKDDLEKGYVNGYYVGKAQGTKMQDKEKVEDDDGYKFVRETERFGTVMQDVENPNFPEPEAEDNGDGGEEGED